MKKDLFSKLRDKALELTYVGLVKYILSLILTSSFLTYLVQLLTSYLGLFDGNKLIISIIVFSGTALLFISLYNRVYNLYRPIYAKVDSDFIILNKEISYVFSNRTDSTYTLKLSLKALKNGLKCYKGRYRWTGVGDMQITCPIKEHIFKKTENTVYQYYEINFYKTLKKGDLIDTQLNFDLKDTEEAAAPFVSSTIQDPTERLKITLKLPNSFKVNKVVCDVCSNVGGSVLDSDEKSLDHNGEVKWEIQKPKLLHCYQILWRY